MLQLGVAHPLEDKVVCASTLVYAVLPVICVASRRVCWQVRFRSEPRLCPSLAPLDDTLAIHHVTHRLTMDRPREPPGPLVVGSALRVGIIVVCRRGCSLPTSRSGSRRRRRSSPPLVNANTSALAGTTTQITRIINGAHSSPSCHIDHHMYHHAVTAADKHEQSDQRARITAIRKQAKSKSSP